MVLDSTNLLVPNHLQNDSMSTGIESSQVKKADFLHPHAAVSLHFLDLHTSNILKSHLAETLHYKTSTIDQMLQRYKGHHFPIMRVHKHMSSLKKKGDKENDVWKARFEKNNEKSKY